MAKLALGLGLLAGLLLWRDTAARMGELLLGFETRYLAVLVAVALLMRAVSALKWWILLRDAGIRVAIGRLFGLYLIGQFFNNFLPSMIGGDVTKSLLLGRQIRSQSRSAASVFVDRLTGLIALIVMALSLASLNLDLIADPVIGVPVAGVTLGAIGLVIALFNARALGALARRLGAWAFLEPVIRALAQFHGAVMEYRHRRRALALAFVCSTVFYFLASLSVYYSCAAIGYRPAFSDVALITPIIFLVTTIPVSPNNIGWWEWSVGLLLGGTGATLADGVMVALTMRAVSTAISLLGGVLFLMERVEGHAPPAR